MNKKDKLIVIGKGYPRKNLFAGPNGSSYIERQQQINDFNNSMNNYSPANDGWWNYTDTSNAANLTSYAGQSATGATDLSTKKLPDLKNAAGAAGSFAAGIGNGSGGIGYGAIGTAANAAVDVLDKAFINKGAHNKVGDVLNTVSDVMPAWTPYTLLAKGILKTAGIVANGLTNTVNDQQVKQKGIELSNLAGLTSNAADYENLQQAYDTYRRINVGLGKIDDWGSAGFLSSGSKRKEAFRNAKNALSTAMGMRDNNLYQTGMNINKNNIFNQLGTLRAFGGPLGMWDTSGAVNYGFMSDWLATKNKQAENKNNLGAGTIGTVPSYMNSFASGGGKFGGGSFEGSGSGGSWDDEPANTYNVSNFNEAFDRAVKEGRKEFIFQGRVYNTKKENNPVREFNNRWVGQGRKANKKNPSKSYDHQAGPIGGALAAIPIVTDTYIGSPERPPQLEYRDTPVENMEGILLDKGFINNTFFPSYLPMSKPIKRALGGVLQTHGGDWSDGLVTIGAGGTHEENPNEGVQSGVDPEGVPNLVEEGEAIWNDYVFSNRIEVPEEVKKHLKVHGKDLTFADAAKKLEKEISERPNDPISKAGFKASMEYLENAQEEVKAKMEAEEAQEAFNALPPEEQVAIMQQAAQQEQMSQEQAMQEQAMAEQAAAQQQPTPEEMAMMQQQVPQEQIMADGSQPNISQSPQTVAFGGKVNRFDKGGLKERVAKVLNLHTQGEIDKWLKDNNLEDLDWDNALKNQDFITALGKNNPALADALKRGYDFGLYTPEQLQKVTFADIANGNWDNGWKDAEGIKNAWRHSKDPMMKEILEDEEKRKAFEAIQNTEDAENLFRSTDAYQRGTKWLQESEENRRLYLQALIDNPDTPPAAKEFAEKYIDKNGNWKKDVAKDYDTVFSRTRGFQPGSYWHTPTEILRGNTTGNYVINDDGTVEEIIGDVPTDWKMEGNPYTWATAGDDTNPGMDYTYTYYRRPSSASNNTPQTPEEIARAKAEAEQAAMDAAGVSVAPIHRNENLRYVGLMGPALGLGMQMAGIGRPDTSGIMAAAARAGQPPALATYKPIGEYLKYNPYDVNYAANQLANTSAGNRRAILNSNASAGARNAMLLAQNFNDQNALGNLYRQAQEYNNQHRAQVSDFNRGTDQFNAQASTQTSQFNTDAINRNKQYASQMAMQAAREKMDADAGWYQNIYGNIGALTKGISDLGRENAQRNMIADMAANGIFGKATPNTHGFNTIIQYVDKDGNPMIKDANGKWVRAAAKGGKLNKKRRGGLTY